jgi:hypothetical protein
VLTSSPGSDALRQSDNDDRYVQHLRVLFRAAGIEPENEGACLSSFPLDVDLDTEVDLTSPVVAPVLPHVPQLVDQARASLNAGMAYEFGGHPLPADAVAVEYAVLMQLSRYEEPQAGAI